jgi:hypothetical protein
MAVGQEPVIYCLHYHNTISVSFSITHSNKLVPQLLRGRIVVLHKDITVVVATLTRLRRELQLRFLTGQEN